MITWKKLAPVLLQCHYPRAHALLPMRMSHSPSPVISITPSNALVDQKTRIELSGLPRMSPVTLAASLVEDGYEYVSHAYYTTDASGRVDVTEMPSSGGSYVGIEKMGLFWSLHPAPGQRKGLRLMKKDVTTPFAIDMYVMGGHHDFIGKKALSDPLCKSRVLRWFMGPGVQRHSVRSGRLRGTLFLPPGDGNRPFPAVVDLYGTAGGLVEYRAALLASRGIAAMALAFFMYDDLPEGLSIEMEYFKEAVDWLEKHPKVDRHRLGVIGLSKGAELAMTLASIDHRIKSVVSINGTSYRHTGEVFFQGVELPAADLDVSAIKVTDEGYNFYKCFSQSTGQKEAAIQVETAENAKFLFINCEKDAQCPGNEGSRLAERMRSHGKENYTCLCMPGAGHLLEPPYTPHCGAAFHRIIGNNMVTGGELIPHTRAQEQAWKHILAMLRSNLEDIHVSKL